MEILESGCLVILGRTNSGRVFRPSDWDQRLCCSVSKFEDGRLTYSKYVRPIHKDKDKGVFIAAELKRKTRNSGISLSISQRTTIWSSSGLKSASCRKHRPPDPHRASFGRSRPAASPMQPCRNRLGKRLFSRQSAQVAFRGLPRREPRYPARRIDPRRRAIEQIVIIEGDDARSCTAQYQWRFL